MGAQGALVLVAVCLLAAVPASGSGTQHGPLRLAAPGDLPPLPEIERGIGPGTRLQILFPGGGSAGCTANFVWTDGADLYLGTAGHCIVRGSAVATHGPDADYDASGVVVQAAMEGCLLAPSTAAASLTTCVEKPLVWAALGGVAYARQDPLGHDFALVRIPPALHASVRTELPNWGGPSGSADLAAGDAVLYYGHGMAYDAMPALRKRFGTGIGADPLSDAFVAQGPAYVGDSGSAVVRGAPTGDGRLWTGREAIGILTNAAPNAGFGAAAFYGTTVFHAKRDALCYAGLSVRVVPGDAALGPGVACP